MQDFKKLFNYLSPYRSMVIVSVFCHVLMAIFTVISIPLIIPFFHFLFSTTPKSVDRPDSYLKIVDWLQYYFLQLIDNFGPSNTLILTCIFLLITIFLKNLFRYLAMYFMVPVRSGIVRDLRNTLYNSFLNFSFDDQKDSQRGDLLTRINSDVQEIEWNILRFIDTILKSPIIIVGAILLMLSISYKLTAFVFVLMLFTVLVIGTLSRKLKKQSKDLQDGVSRLTSIIDETLDGVMILNVYRVKNVWSKMFGAINNDVRNKFNKVVRRQELSSPLSEFLGVSVVVVLLWYGAKLVMKNELQPEAFFAFVLAFYHVIEPLKSFSTAYYYVKKGAASLERIEDIVISDNAIDQDRHSSFTFENELSLNNVSYSYDDTKVLNDISFKIKKGQKIAIVGASGSGKSTIARLLLQIIKPDVGTLSIDGTNMWNIDKNTLYKSIGFVTQQSFLYNDTIRNNILLGRSNIDDAKIMASLKLACADDFVSQLPNGLDSVIGDRGSALSGGEQQRLTIARALLEDPEILILDEPTSALDPQSEKVVSQAIINILEERTAIIVAHRLSTIKFVDYIFVLDEGKIVESGSHEELSLRNGIYSNYVKIQSVNI
jgi:subfamily B ATP-binding cassette protein MsbA